ncbi:hypothetical protein MNEG_11907, partial [Monoraphidium neglectum]
MKGPTQRLSRGNASAPEAAARKLLRQSLRHPAQPGDLGVPAASGSSSLQPAAHHQPCFS